MIDKSEVPSTVVSVDKLTVKQTRQHNVYDVLRREREQEELNKIVGNPSVESEINQTPQNFFHDVQDNSYMIKSFCEEIFKPYHPSLREVI